MGCSKASVSRVINAVVLKGRAGCGKQKKTTPQDDIQLCRIAKTNRFSSATQFSQLSQKWSCALGREVSTATTFRHLREMGLRCRKPATKLLLNRKEKLKRLQWANMHKDCTKMHKNGQVIFSDQSKFCIKFGDRGALAWKTKDERYNPACLKRSVKFPTSVMVWGCVLEVWVILSSSNQQLQPMCIWKYKSHLLSSIEDMYGICMAMKT